MKKMKGTNETHAERAELRSVQLNIEKLIDERIIHEQDTAALEQIRADVISLRCAELS